MCLPGPNLANSFFGGARPLALAPCRLQRRQSTGACGPAPLRSATEKPPRGSPHGPPPRLIVCWGPALVVRDPLGGPWGSRPMGPPGGPRGPRFVGTSYSPGLPQAPGRLQPMGNPGAPSWYGCERIRRTSSSQNFKIGFLTYFWGPGWFPLDSP